MRSYLVDGANAARRGGFDPRFPEMAERRAADFVGRLCALAAPHAGRVSVEVVFDGPRRALGDVSPPVTLRFSGPETADDLILGTVRALRARGLGACVATEDRELRGRVQEEGARVLGFFELEDRLRRGRA